MNERKKWVNRSEPLPLTRQCELTGVARSTVYAPERIAVASEEELELLGLIDAEYTRHPFYGSRKIRTFLCDLGYEINRKRVQRLMRAQGLAGMAPGPNTSHPHPENKVYPYLLRGVAVTHPNHVWSTDITYIRLPRGFVYLVAVIDWYSRKVLAWRLSNTLERNSVWTVWSRQYRRMAHRKYLIPIRDASSQAKPLLACLNHTRLPSVWMDVGEHWITSLWNGYGAA